MPSKKQAKDTLRITLIRSPIGRQKSQKATVEALGLRRLNHTVEKEDTPAIRGMIDKISHLVVVEQ
jgi:large subunit ribosomal protein L30